MYDHQVIIRARVAGHVLEFLRPEIFSVDLPDCFSKDHLPWLDTTTLEIGFRPISAPWKSCRPNWIMKLGVLTRQPSIMRLGNMRLLDPKSETGLTIIETL